ncbi:MAG: selenocysteine-specific translation elongation factor [Deltaproteobacteria bacterium]|nr:selenocysteine-specific translation elongation factor [Deltaproteobacteria bacterium]
MKQIILGTAGHIDHGKTSLIKALTGINTDRLKEEQLRGITIELGFASMDLPSGQHIGIVDVPGHEKFVKTMVAGATGIDMVVMVIAADEGIMPQTREHMEICTLLNIQHGLVVLTKRDMVDEEWLELVIEDVRSFAAGSFLEDAPILPVSSTTGQGIPELIQALETLSASIPERSTTNLFRLPVDRVFTMKGFGTVITGTLISGMIRVGDPIMIYPSGVTSKVRGIQVHNASVEQAVSGMRTAINFQGLEKASINRGDVLSSPNALTSSFMVDIRLHYLKSNKKPVKNRTRIRFHTGTSEVLGNLILLDSEELSPGDATAAQLRLDAPVAVVKDDRFVIRSYSPVRTIGGGSILNPIPQKHKRFKPEIFSGIQKLGDLSPEEVITYHAEDAGYQGISFSDLRIMTNISDKKLDGSIQRLLSDKVLLLIDRDQRIFIHQSCFEQLTSEACSLLSAFHKSNPLKPGMPKEELKSRLPLQISTKLFTLMSQQMVKSGRLIQEENMIRLSTHSVLLGQDQTDVRKKILDAYQQNGLTPPYFKEFCKTENLDTAKSKEVLHVLIDEGLIVKIKDDLYFHQEAIQMIKKKLVEFLNIHGEITTPQFKDMTGASRKFVIPIIEYFDARNVTIRVGDIRKLRNG